MLYEKCQDITLDPIMGCTLILMFIIIRLKNIQMWSLDIAPEMIKVQVIETISITSHII